MLRAIMGKKVKSFKVIPTYSLEARKGCGWTNLNVLINGIKVWGKGGPSESGTCPQLTLAIGDELGVSGGVDGCGFELDGNDHNFGQGGSIIIDKVYSKVHFYSTCASPM